MPLHYPAISEENPYKTGYMAVLLTCLGKNPVERLGVEPRSWLVRPVEAFPPHTLLTKLIILPFLWQLLCLIPFPEIGNSLGSRIGAPSPPLQSLVASHTKLGNLAVAILALLITFMPHMTAPADSIAIFGVVSRGRNLAAPVVRVLGRRVTTLKEAPPVPAPYPKRENAISLLGRPWFRLHGQ